MYGMSQIQETIGFVTDGSVDRSHSNLFINVYYMWPCLR